MISHRTKLLVALFALILPVSGLAQQKGWFRTTGAQIQAAPLVVDLDGDQKKEIIVPSFDDKLYVYNHDGTPFNPGAAPWPKLLGFGDGAIASAAVGDVDGDGAAEIVVVGDDINGQNAKVKVYRANGALVTEWLLNANATGKATPCLINCVRYNGQNPHPAEEILIRDGDGKVYILQWTGSVLMDRYDANYFNTCSTDTYFDRFGSMPITSSVAAVSLPNNKTYIAVGSSDGKVYRWEVTSTASSNCQVSNLPACQSIGNSGCRFLSSPAIADVDNNGRYEIAIGGSDRKVYLFNDDGAIRSGWPQSTTQPIVSSPALANIDSDAELELAIGSDDGVVYVWDSDGTPLTGWSTPMLITSGDVFASPVLAEINGVAGLDIVAASLDGYLYAWDGLGALLPGWPKRMNSPLYGSPAVADLHASGRHSIVVAGYDGRVYVMDLKTKSLNINAGWPQFRGGPKRTGTP